MTLRQKLLLRRLHKSKIPSHVAIIMDGNGRWAQRRGLPRIAGHRAGLEAVRRTVRIASRSGIKYLTLYAFSTENWNRPREEIDGLFSIFLQVFDKEIEELHRNNVRVRPMGNVDAFPHELAQAIRRAEEMTRSNDGLFLNLALNYGGRDEIVCAARRVVQEVQRGNLRVEELDCETFAKFLYLPDTPYPDLLIRTSGEMRISNFLLWQVAYTEFYFTPTLWPDFDEVDFLKALISYQFRARRFGGLSDESAR